MSIRHFVYGVFEGHGYYLDSLWTNRARALERATEVAREENGLIKPEAQWRSDIEGRYLRELWLDELPMEGDTDDD